MKNIKYLAFITAVDFGSFSKAADALGYTQSGLTHMMNRLEDEIGFPLINRNFYGVRPTEKGKQLIPIIREILKNEDTLSAEIEHLKRDDKQVIKIGAYSSIALNWLPSIVENFNKDYPDVVVKIQTGTVPNLYAGIQNDDYDMVFVSKNNKYNTEFIKLKTDEMLAILPKNYYGGDNPTNFDINDFNKKRFLMPGLGFNIDILKMFEDYSISPNIEETFLDDLAIMSMVEHGLGISMLSELIVSGRDEGILCLPLSPSIQRVLGIAYGRNKELSDIMKKFIKYSKAFVESV